MRASSSPAPAMLPSTSSRLSTWPQGSASRRPVAVKSAERLRGSANTPRKTHELQLAPRRRLSYITRKRDVNKLPEVKVDTTSVAVIQMRRAERTELDKARIQLTAGLRARWRSYQRALKEKPISTKALTSFWGLGHFWYEMLDRVVMPQQPKSTRAIATKMLADQLIWSPVNTMIFYASLAIMEGHSSDVASILHDKLFATVVAGYCLWPLAHIVNFKFVPSRNRLLYINVVNLFWSIFLAKQANTTAVVMYDPPAQLPITPIPVSSAATPPPQTHIA